MSTKKLLLILTLATFGIVSCGPTHAGNAGQSVESPQQSAEQGSPDISDDSGMNLELYKAISETESSLYQIGIDDGAFKTDAEWRRFVRFRVDATNFSNQMDIGFLGTTMKGKVVSGLSAKGTHEAKRLTEECHIHQAIVQKSGYELKCFFGVTPERP